MNSNRDLTNIVGYIYKITAPNGAVYIGQTVNIYKRKHAYKKLGYKRQTKLYNSCKKYNWIPSDTFEVIEECVCGYNKININDREKYWISYYDSFNNGLNCTEGGDGQLSKIWTEEEKERQRQITLSNGTGFVKGNKINLGKKLTQEHISKIVESKKEYLLHNDHWNKGKVLTDEHKEKLSNSLKGEKNGFYGKKHNDETREIMKMKRANQVITEETKRKMSESQLNRDKSNDRKHTVSVFQYDMEGNFIQKFESIKEASEKTNTLGSSIIRVCKGRRKSSNNFMWSYNNLI